jgi:V/A-type H+-transporting ATPase subunit E
MLERSGQLDGIQAILDRILADARDRSDYLIAQADQAAADTVTTAKANGEQLLAQADVLASGQAEAILSRARSAVAMEKRKTMLQARQDLIDATIVRAGYLVQQLPDADKVSFCRSLLQTAKINKGSVILPASDRRLGSAILTGLDHETSFVLDDEDGDFTGGLIIRQGQVEENLTLDLLIKNSRTQLVQLAASILFPPDEGETAGPLRDPEGAGQ